jgi:hypothetical protein
VKADHIGSLNMPAQIDRPVNGDDVVLLERTTAQGYRDWLISYVGGIEQLSAAFRDRMLSPEKELETLLALMLPGDELWLARSRVFQPEALIGNRGIAVVRDGAAVWYRIGIHH